MRQGFTLIELLVVIVMLTLVMSVVVPSGAKVLDQSKVVFDNAVRKYTFQLQRMEAFSSGVSREVVYAGQTYRLKPNGIYVVVSP